MTIRIAALLLSGLLVSLAPVLAPARAQDSKTRLEPGSPAASDTSREYVELCRQRGIRCKLAYPEKVVDRPAIASPRAPALLSGPAAPLLALAALAVLVGLWLRFGAGGVLLSPAPRDMKRQRTDAPGNWSASDLQADEPPEQFLQRIAAMEDRKLALVQLLRRCLLHAADATGTRLFRSDTERVVLRRLPTDMTGRDRLETLLAGTELAHYGGRTPADAQFAALLDAARGLLTGGGRAHA
ncbi:hypothetical protein ACERNI_13565 [Camelimonas sp. ID_303_24]